MCPSHLLLCQCVLNNAFFPVALLGQLIFSLSEKLIPPPTTATASHQARRELRQLKKEARQKHAVSVIWAGWQGTKVF